MPAETVVALTREEAEVTHRALTARIVDTTSPEVFHLDTVPARIARVYALAQALARLGQPADPLNTAEVPPAAAELIAETLNQYGEQADDLAEACACGDMTGRSEMNAAEWWRREGAVARHAARRIAG
jgi:hypothetical protein